MTTKQMHATLPCNKLLCWQFILNAEHLDDNAQIGDYNLLLSVNYWNHETWAVAWATVLYNSELGHTWPNTVLACHLRVVQKNYDDIGHKPYRPQKFHIGHKKCPYRPQTISATSISATGRKPVDDILLLHFNSSLRLKLTRSSATAEITAVGRCVYADAIYMASFGRSRVYSHSR